MQRKNNSAKEMRFVINVGAQKAGTSWLFKCLEEHPDVCTAKGKETHFFSNEQNPNLHKYLSSFFPEHKRERVMYESSTSYLYEPSVPQKINEVLGDVKIIVILRDPVARSLSHLNHLRNKGASNGLNDKQILSKYPEIVEHSLYQKHLKAFCEKFSKQQLLILDFDDIADRPQEFLNNVTDFIGVERFSPSNMKSKYNSGNARNNRLYRTCTKWYVRLSKYRYVDWLPTLFRKIGLNSFVLEKILVATSPRKPIKIDGGVKKLLESQLQNERESYFSMMKNR